RQRANSGPAWSAEYVADSASSPSSRHLPSAPLISRAKATAARGLRAAVASTAASSSLSGRTTTSQQVAATTDAGSSTSLNPTTTAGASDPSAGAAPSSDA